MTSISSNDNGQFVPLSDYVLLVGKCERLEREREALNTEVLQLREALKRVNAGIHKASDITDAIRETVLRLEDDKLITNLAINVMRKHHPKSMTIKGKSGIVVDIIDNDPK